MLCCHAQELLRIGASDWQYRHWRGGFYPEGCPQLRWLERYAEIMGAQSAWAQQGRDVNAMLKKQFNMSALDFSNISQYWSAKIEGRDGFSGSPVFNDKAEVVGVFSGYDWSKKLAVISPGANVQKLLDEYNSEQKH